MATGRAEDEAPPGGASRPGPTPGDLPVPEYRALARRVADWTADYLDGVGELPVFPGGMRPGDLRRALPDAAPEEAESMDEVLEDFRRLVVPGLTHWNHPRFFGYFSITGSGPGILGETLAAALNVNAMVWRSSPAATELEEVTMAWLRRLVGLPESFDGVINDTASTATFYALAAARERAYPEVHENGLFGARPGRVYASDQAHSSVEKAVLALGLGKAGFRAVPSDDAFRMRPDALAEAVREDVDAGWLPLAVVPTLGTTSTTSVDPVGEIVEIAGAHGMWVHVDAAYGGPAAVLHEVRALFQGWEEADSIVLNPHKWLFTPIDCSALYCRHPDLLRRTFSLVPAYLQTPEGEGAKNLMDYGVALGRRFRSLKLWFVLRAFGKRGIEARIRHHMDLARELAAWVDAHPRWERVAPVPFALVVLRFVPEGVSESEADRLNEAVIREANASGEVFVGPTRLNGRIVIRFAIGNLKTTREDVRRGWEALQRAAAAVAAGEAAEG